MTGLRGLRGRWRGGAFGLIWAVVALAGGAAAWAEVASVDDPADSPAPPRYNEQRVPAVSSPITDRFARVLRELGRVPPSFAGPLNEQELRLWLASIDPYRLSAAGSSTFAAIEAELDRLSRTPLVDERSEPTEPGFAFDASLALALEAYSRSNDAVAWRIGYGRRRPIIDIGMNFFLGDFGFLGAQFDLRQEYFAADQPGNWLNLTDDFGYYDMQFPFRAYLSIGQPHWNIRVGRDKLNWGPGMTGNIAVSDEPHFYEFLQLRSYWPVFAYTGTVIAFEPWLIGGSDHQGGVTAPLVGATTLSEAKHLFLHRFDFQPWDFLLFAVTEGLMFGNRLPDLRLFNPIMLLHNFYIWEYASSLTSVELALNPWRYLTLYGNLAWNQITSAYEAERYAATAEPNAFAYLAGAAASIPWGNGYLDIGYEFVLTDPWMYVREFPNTSYHWRRRVLTNLLGANVPVTLPIGYRYGNDTLVHALRLGYEIAGIFGVTADYEYRARGTQRVDSPYAVGADAVAMVTPHAGATAAVEYTHGIYLSAQIEPVALIAALSAAGNAAEGAAQRSPVVDIRLDLSVEMITNSQNQPGNDQTSVQFVVSTGVLF